MSRAFLLARNGRTTMKMTIEEAASNLEFLIREAATGAEVVITRGDTPLARLVAAQPPRPQARFGSAQGSVWMAPDFDDPLEDFKDYM